MGWGGTSHRGSQIACCKTLLHSLVAHKGPADLSIYLSIFWPSHLVRFRALVHLLAPLCVALCVASSALVRGMASRGWQHGSVDWEAWHGWTAPETPADTDEPPAGTQIPQTPPAGTQIPRTPAAGTMIPQTPAAGTQLPRTLAPFIPQALPRGLQVPQTPPSTMQVHVPEVSAVQSPRAPEVAHMQALPRGFCPYHGSNRPIYFTIDFSPGDHREMIIKCASCQTVYLHVQANETITTPPYI